MGQRGFMGEIGVTTAEAWTADAAAMCAAVQRGLRGERLTRRELSDCEHGLERVLAVVEPRWTTAERALGPTPEVRLGGAAVNALAESVSWARRFRKHAPLRERRERIELGLQGALGAITLMGRIEALLVGPQLACAQDRYG
jgi:hypothetical protein